MLKRTGTRTQPCLTPTSTLKRADCMLPVLAFACIPSWSWCRTLQNLGGMPLFDSRIHKSSQLTMSNALDKSLEAMNRSLCCSQLFSWTGQAMKIVSLLCSFLKPTCISSKMCSGSCWTSQASMTSERILPATASKDIPLLLPHTTPTPFCCKMITTLHQRQAASYGKSNRTGLTTTLLKCTICWLPKSVHMTQSLQTNTLQHLTTQGLGRNT